MWSGLQQAEKGGEVSRLETGELRPRMTQMDADAKSVGEVSLQARSEMADWRFEIGI